MAKPHASSTFRLGLGQVDLRSGRPLVFYSPPFGNINLSHIVPLTVPTDRELLTSDARGEHQWGKLGGYAHVKVSQSRFFLSLFVLSSSSWCLGVE
jgi:hypothetical protein